ncbi:50S ribosomal protein L25 [Brachyspira pilosicoli]|uniref:Large ribosomal subunit protein bL25 n=1 Tax=Brachyspira pilosicoli TaxID=52584 RepID=A0A5C8EWC5_BRAPL|nr:50S ribosomal protein L25 [Brachyspira pilosicoli]TXJ41718.1 50S ribosomal protein L25 [Brachyspira pilosicoli]
MSENYTIKALQRDTTKKSVGRKLINDGYALATLYGRGKEYSIAVELKEFVKIFSLAGQHDIITLDIENDKAREVLVKDYQLDGIKRTIRHIDFYEIDRNKKIKTFVPIRIEGTPEGVRLGGGTLEQVEYELPIKAFPASIPREITIDVTDLKVGSSLHISDIKFPEGVDPVGDASKAVVTVVTTQDEDTPNKNAAAEA